MLYLDNGGKKMLEGGLLVSQNIMFLCKVSEVFVTLPPIMFRNKRTTSNHIDAN